MGEPRKRSVGSGIVRLQPRSREEEQLWKILKELRALRAAVEKVLGPGESQEES